MIIYIKKNFVLNINDLDFNSYLRDVWIAIKTNNNNKKKVCVCDYKK